MTINPKRNLELTFDESTMTAHAKVKDQVLRFDHSDSGPSRAQRNRAKEIVRRVNVYEELCKALEAAEYAIEEATDAMHFGDGLPVTALESWEIERTYDSLASVMVQIHEALGSARAIKKKSPCE